MRKGIAAFLICWLAVASLQADQSGPLAEGQYVTVRDGHLSYRGRRLRLWGAGFCHQVYTQGQGSLAVWCGKSVVHHHPRFICMRNICYVLDIYNCH